MNTIEIYGPDDACGWRLKASNGRILCGAYNGNGFSSLKVCTANIESTAAAFTSFTMSIPTPKIYEVGQSLIIGGLKLLRVSS